MPFMHLFIILSTLMVPLAAWSSNSELHLQLEGKLIQKLLNEATSYIVDENYQVVRKLPSYNHEIKLNINDLKLDSEVMDFAHNIVKIDRNGIGSLKILLEQPEVRGSLFFGTPIIRPAADGNFTLELEAKIENFNINFRHIWFTSSGLIDLDELSEESCHHLISSPSAIEGEDFILNSTQSRIELKNYLASFYKKLDRLNYQGHEGNLWARIDDFQLGWGAKQLFQDSRNKIKINIKVLVDTKSGGQRISLVSFKHNLFKKNGALVPVYMPSKNIILPPTFIRTKTRKIVDGIQTDEEVPRCTYVNSTPTKKLISTFSPQIAKQIALQVTDQNINKLVETANSKLKSLSIPELPEGFAIGNEDNMSIKSQQSIYGQTFYVYQDINFDFNKDLFGIIKNFTTYRAAVGFENLMANEVSNSLEMGLNSDLVIDGTELRYHESNFWKLPIKADDFKWSYDFGSDASLAVNGKFLNKIINPIKNHFLKTKLPEGVNVYIDDNLFQVDKNGWIDITPKIELNVKGYEVLRVAFNVKAKPEVLSTQDGKHWLKINYDVPTAESILNSVKLGTIVKTTETVVNILLWPLYPLKEYVIKPKLKEEIRWRLQSYIDNIKSHYKEVETTSFVKTYGVRPSKLKFHKLSQDNYMELKLQIQKFYGLDKVMKEIK